MLAKTPGRTKQFFSGEFAAVIGGGDDASPTVVVAGSDDGCVALEAAVVFAAGALRTKVVDKSAGEVLIEKTKWAGILVDHCHRGAKAIKRAGIFAGDNARTQNDQRLWLIDHRKRNCRYRVGARDRWECLQVRVAENRRQ